MATLPKLWLGGYSPFDKKPDEDLYKQSWYFLKVAAPFCEYFLCVVIFRQYLTLVLNPSTALIGGLNIVFQESLKKKPFELLAIFARTNWPVVAICYGGVAATAMIYNLRGGDNWRSKGSPYFLGFLAASTIVFTRTRKSSFAGFWSAVPIAGTVALMQWYREKGWPNDLDWHQPHMKEEALNLFGNYGQKDMNLTNTKRFVDPGRRPVF